ncbi:MAG: D-aminoacyl-tRNA deacylase [Ignavibacteria bacterium]|nr:D-aminoacyl-tRNA deacylase [Ignavibacteria bacterium]
MIAVIQRVSESTVYIENEMYSNIGEGLLILLGVEKGDNEERSAYLAKKAIDLRIFPDKNDKMNLNVKDVDGEVMVISQFTLCTDKSKSGNRPSFTMAELPEIANRLYENFISELKNYYDKNKIKSGLFAGKMDVKLTNKGPVTILMEKKN